MASPTGTCNGQPCWTAADKAQLDAEITTQQAAIATTQADILLDQATLAQQQNQLNVLLSQKTNSINNSCPS